jgi:hypothetical protein
MVVALLKEPGNLDYAFEPASATRSKIWAQRSKKTLTLGRMRYIRGFRGGRAGLTEERTTVAADTIPIARDARCSSDGA